MRQVLNYLFILIIAVQLSSCDSSGFTSSGGKGGGSKDSSKTDADSKNDGNSNGGSNVTLNPDGTAIDSNQKKNGEIKSDTGEVPRVFDVTMIGFNVEDDRNAAIGGGDYNDANICFSGKFTISETSTVTKVVSNVDQTVPVAFASDASCVHEITIKITDPGAVARTVVRSSKPNSSVSMDFKKGSELYYTSRTTTNNGSCVDSLDMNNRGNIHIAYNVCK